MSVEELSRVSEQGRGYNSGERGYNRGQVISFDDNRVFRLTKGLVGVASGPRGSQRRWIGRVVKPGDLFGFENFGNDNFFEGEVLTKAVEVVEIDRADIDPEVMLRTMAKTIEHMRQKQFDLRSGLMLRRLAHALFELGEYDRESGKLQVGVLGERIAEIVGVGRTTVSKEMGKLQDRGILGTQGQTYVIRDPRRLARIATR